MPEYIPASFFSVERSRRKLVAADVRRRSPASPRSRRRKEAVPASSPRSRRRKEAVPASSPRLLQTSQTPEPRPKTPTRARRAFYLRPRYDGVPDILDAIQDLGGIASPTQSRFRDAGDYDGFAEAFTGPARLLIRSQGGSPPDKLVQALSDPDAPQVFRLESTSDLYDAVAAAVESRAADRRQAQRDKVDQEFFETATAGDGCDLTTRELKVGDRFGLKRDKCEVRRVDPVEVDVECSPKFGRQRLPEGAKFSPNKCKIEKAPAVNPKRRNPAGFFDRPESVAEQKARLAAEQARRLAAEQREELKRRASARLVGRSVDTTGDLFDPGKADAPLFARKNPVILAERKGPFWNVRTRRIVLARRLTDGQLMRWLRTRGYSVQQAR